nr:Flp pilus assembly protein, protease CpaA [Streptococcus thermophilus]
MLVGGIVAGVWSIALVLYDVSQRRLPNFLTLPAAALALIYCVFNPQGLWGLVWPALYLLLVLRRGTGKNTEAGMGGGDIKLGVPLGVALAAIAGVQAVLAAMLLASVLTVVFLLLKRLNDTAHGPSMLAAAWIVGLACTDMWSL